jgi:competence protein ComEC
MLTGDIEEPAESTICRQPIDLTADILKAAHHGSRTSTSELFLDRIHPQVAVISAGKRNSFGHPHRIVLERLARRGIKALRTDETGAVTVESDGDTLRIATERPLP